MLSRVSYQQVLGRLSLIFSKNGLFASSKSSAIVIGILSPILLPFIHLGIINKIWYRYTRDIDRLHCSCSCWDTAFKGIYEVGVADYKHVYVNSTWNSFQIWSVTVLAVIGAYEIVKRISYLALGNKLRLTIALALGAQIYPHYYAWWSYFNYLNDDFYSQWYHQLFFTVTECVSTVALVKLLDRRQQTSVESLLVILNVSVMHVLVSSTDQAFANVLKGQGGLHQVLRDMGFFMSDMVQGFVAIVEFKKLGKAKHVPFTYLITNKQFVHSVVFVCVSWIVTRII